MSVALQYYNSGDGKRGDEESLKDEKALYYACKWNRMKGNNLQASKFYELGYLLPCSEMRKWEWALEKSIFLFYICGPDKKAALKSILSSLSDVRSITVPDDDQFINFMNNLVFYTGPLNFPKNEVGSPRVENFNSSTPCISYLKEKLVILVRYVDYTIHSTKLDHYSLASSAEWVIHSVYRMKIGNGEWKTVSFNDGEFIKDPKCPFKGIEDIRLFPDGDKIYGIGSLYEYVSGYNGTIALLDVDLENAIITPIRLFPRRQKCEKNHSPIIGTRMLVYSWGPLCIYDLDSPEKFQFEYEDLPVIFKRMRGSTSGVPYPSTGNVESYWFITHVKSDKAPWVFSFCVVLLSPVDYKPVSYSIPFFFEGPQIEFTLGFVFIEDDTQLLISYSVLDKCSRLVKVPVSEIQDMMIRCW